MSSVDFKTLLSKPASDIKKPVPLPAGTYRGVVLNHSFEVSSKKQTPFVRFYLQPQSAEADVDEEALVGVEITKKKLKIDFYLTPDAEFRVIDLGKSLGYQTEGRSLGEVITEISTNSPVLMEVTQQNSLDGQEIYNNVNKMRGQE